MLQFIAKLYIQRSLDYHKPLPFWVARRLKSDQKLAQYRQRLIELQERLKSDASAWLDRKVQTSIRPYSPAANAGSRKMASKEQFNLENRRRVSAAYFAVAALVLVAIAFGASQFRSQKPDLDRDLANSSSDSPKAKSRDERFLKIAVGGAQKLADQVHTMGLTQSANAIAATNLLAQLQTSWPSDSELKQWNSKSIAQLRNCVGSAGRSTGQFFNQLGIGFRDSESDISEQMGSSVNSFRRTWSGIADSFGNSIRQTP